MDGLNKKSFIVLAVISGITTLLMLLTFNYWDGQTLMAWSVNNYDILVEGRIRDFYIDKQVNLRGAIQTDGCSSPFMLIPQMIWNFPIWITHYFNGNLNVATLPCIYWYKLFLVVMTILCGCVCYKIIYQLTNDKNRATMGLLLMCATPEVILSTMYTGQDEVVYLFFILMALYSSINNKKRAFIVWSMCAITCCPIMLIPFTVMLFVKEKKILKIVMSYLIVFIPTILWEVISIGAPAKEVVGIDSGAFASGMMDLINFSSTTGMVSVAGVILVVLVFWCYYDKSSTFEVETVALNDSIQIIWYVAVSMILISFLMDNFFYRLLLYVPFVLILVLGSEKKRTLSLNMFLVSVLAYLRMFTGGYNSPQNMNTTYVARTNILMKICEMTGSTKYDVYDGLNDKILEKLPLLADYVTLMNAVIIAAALILLYINHPKNRREYELAIPVKVSVIFNVLCMPLFLFVFYGLLLK